MSDIWFARFDRDGVAFDCTTNPSTAQDWQGRGWHVESLPPGAGGTSWRLFVSYGLRMAAPVAVLLLGFLSGTSWGYIAPWATLALWAIALIIGYVLWAAADLAEPWEYPVPEFEVE